MDPYGMSPDVSAGLGRFVPLADGSVQQSEGRAARPVEQCSVLAVPGRTGLKPARKTGAARQFVLNKTKLCNTI